MKKQSKAPKPAKVWAVVGEFGICMRSCGPTESAARGFSIKEYGPCLISGDEPIIPVIIAPSEHYDVVPKPRKPAKKRSGKR